jgi:hypothetical protein
LLYPTPWLGVTPGLHLTQLFHRAGLIQLNPCFGLFISKKPTFFQFVKEQPFSGIRGQVSGISKNQSPPALRLLRAKGFCKPSVLNSHYTAFVALLIPDS